jgi:hypothetical protein
MMHPRSSVLIPNTVTPCSFLAVGLTFLATTVLLLDVMTSVMPLLILDTVSPFLFCQCHQTSRASFVATNNNDY